MGLDMYLSAGRYLSGWRHDQGKPDGEYFERVLAASGLNRDDLSDNGPSGYLKLSVAYWRKANQIHRWFVENVQDGKDECDEHEVSREQLHELVRQCQHALNHREEAATTLPPQEGCFFGSTEIDEGYWEDLEATVTVISGILGNPKLADWGFYYRSSW